MKNFCEMICVLGLLALIALCVGDPDIIDGLAKRAAQCTAVTESGSEP